MRAWDLGWLNQTRLSPELEEGIEEYRAEERRNRKEKELISTIL
jgi:hypothetical protein